MKINWTEYYKQHCRKIAYPKDKLEFGFNKKPQLMEYDIVDNPNGFITNIRDRIEKITFFQFFQYYFYEGYNIQRALYSIVRNTFNSEPIGEVKILKTNPE